MRNGDNSTKPRNRVLAALDVGTTKICCLISKPSQERGSGPRIVGIELQNPGRVVARTNQGEPWSGDSPGSVGLQKGDSITRTRRGITESRIDSRLSWPKTCRQREYVLPSRQAAGLVER